MTTHSLYKDVQLSHYDNKKMYNFDVYLLKLMYDFQNNIKISISQEHYYFMLDDNLTSN